MIGVVALVLWATNGTVVDTPQEKVFEALVLM